MKALQLSGFEQGKSRWQGIERFILEETLGHGFSGSRAAKLERDHRLRIFWRMRAA